MDIFEDGLVGHRRKRELGEVTSGVLGFSFPITIEWYFSPTGAEYCHTYFWIFKDLSWTQEWKFLALGFGLSAIMWSLIILYHSVKFCNGHEIINAIALLLWLFANFWWMTGEVYDVTYPDLESISDARTVQSAHILEVAVCILLVYYFILVPFDAIQITPEQLAEYDDGSIRPRFSYFRTFRQYENVHMIFWLIKDLAWNLENASLWFLCLAPTVLLAIDFFRISYNNENSIVDTVHYGTQLLWVCGNSVWAFGEFFFSDYDDPESLWQDSGEALSTARWYSSWILVLSCVPVVVMYCAWIPLTLSGQLKPIRKLKKNWKSIASAGSVNKGYGTITDARLVSGSFDDIETYRLLAASDSRSYDWIGDEGEEDDDVIISV